MSSANEVNAKTKDLLNNTVTVDGELSKPWGAHIADDERSLKAGVRGPTLLQDFHLRDKIQHFDWERMPERVVHARGFGAHGYFETYKDHSNLTKAKLFHDPSKKTPIFVRFSTVIGNLGSMDTPRDVRGFAIRFYTEEGNWDIVGNNIPVFFIQDAMKFPDLVHALKPEPRNDVPQAQSAHDTAWDFLSLHPESTHMIMWILSDRTIPRSFRMMEGFGVHTFLFVNEEGKARFVKFKYKPLNNPLAALHWDESQKIGGKDPDFHRRDLYEAIERGDYPEWEFGCQIVELENEHDFDFDLLDSTKIIPEKLSPFIPLGKFVLNRNVDNHFSETEQITFHLGHVIPGIDFTNDPLLQGRLFSYSDTQLSRHRSPNYLQLPINRPLFEPHNNQRDGNMQFKIFKGRTHYNPNSFSDGMPKPAENGYQDYPQTVEGGKKTRDRAEKFADFFSQARSFYNSLTIHEKQHLLDAARFEWGQCESKEVRQRIVELINNVDNELARLAAEVIGVTPPEPVFDNKTVKIEDFSEVSMEKYPRKSIRTRQVAVLVADGFDVQSTEQVVSKLKDDGVYVTIIAPVLGPLPGSSLVATKNYATAHSVLFDAIFIADGAKSVDTLMNKALSAWQDPQGFVRDAFIHCKPIAALGEGIKMVQPHIDFSIDKSDELSSKKGIVTMKNSSQNLDEFIAKFEDALLQMRFWDRLPLDI